MDVVEFASAERISQRTAMNSVDIVKGMVAIKNLLDSSEKLFMSVAAVLQSRGGYNDSKNLGHRWILDDSYFV